MTLRTAPIPVTSEEEGPHPLLVAAVETERAHHRALFGHADLVDSAEAVAAGLRRQSSTRRLRVVALDDVADGRTPQVVGSLSLGAPLRDNRELAYFFANPHPDADTGEVLDTLWAAAQPFFDEDGRSVIHVWAQGPAGTGADGEQLVVPRTGAGAVVRDARADWLERTGFVLEQCERYSVLDVTPEVTDRAAGLVLAAEGTAYPIRVWTGPTPEELLEGMAALYRRMSVDAPSADMANEEQQWDADEVLAYDERTAAMGRLTLTAVALDGAGDPVAYTVIGHPTDQPEVAYQDDTLVHGDHRGHGLGRLVKAANLVQLAEAAPTVRRIHTWNAVENSHMLAINEELGFRAAGVEGGWQLRR